jgi:hypothetical protein
MRAADIDRRQDKNGAWLYADPEVHSAAVAWTLNGFSLAELDNYLTEPGWDSEQAQAYRAKLMRSRSEALSAFAAGNQPLMLARLDFLQSALQFRKNHDRLQPLAVEGQKFRAGRKSGTVSKIRTYVADHLKRAPNANAASIWGAIKAKPPKGVAVYENALGKYIETDGQPETKYARFANIVSEERKKLG